MIAKIILAGSALIILAGCTIQPIEEATTPKSDDLAVSIEPKLTRGVLKIVRFKSHPKISDKCDLVNESSGHYTSKSFGARKEDKIEGYGKKIPMALFVSQVVPGEFKVLWQESVSKSLPVTWKGGHAWLALLAKQGKKHNLQFVVNVPSHQILVGQSNKKHSGVYYIGNDAKEKSCLPYFAIGLWQSKPNTPLINTLGKWAKEVKWTVSWGLSPKYVLSKPVSVKGDFVDAVKALIGRARTEKILPDNVLLAVSTSTKTVQIYKKNSEF